MESLAIVAVTLLGVAAISTSESSSTSVRALAEATPALVLLCDASDIDEGTRCAIAVRCAPATPSVRPVVRRRLPACLPVLHRGLRAGSPDSTLVAP